MDSPSTLRDTCIFILHQRENLFHGGTCSTISKISLRKITLRIMRDLLSQTFSSIGPLTRGFLRFTKDNLHIRRQFIAQTRVYDHISKRLAVRQKKSCTLLCVIFSILFSVFENVPKHGISYLIYYFLSLSQVAWSRGLRAFVTVFWLFDYSRTGSCFLHLPLHTRWAGLIFFLPCKNPSSTGIVLIQNFSVIHLS